MKRVDRVTHKGFKVGAEVAVIESSSWGHRVHKRVIGKVRNDGKFFLRNENGVEERMWTPDRFGGPDARPSGERGGYFGRSYIELWTKHDLTLEIEQRRTKAATQRNRLKLWLDKLDTREGEHCVWIDKLIVLAGELDQSQNNPTH